MQPASTCRSSARASCSNAPTPSRRRRHWRWIVAATIASPRRWRSASGPAHRAGFAALSDVASAAELEQVHADVKLRGVIVSSHIEAGWARRACNRSEREAEALGAVVFVHPAGSTEKRMLRHRLMITVGQPLEEAFALSSLIYEGVEWVRFPKLKILVAHGGGYLPFYARRHDRVSLRAFASAQRGVHELPAAVFMTPCTVDPPNMEFLLSKVPASHVMLASIRFARSGTPESGARTGRNSQCQRRAAVGIPV